MSLTFNINNNGLILQVYDAKKQEMLETLEFKDFNISEEDLRKKSCTFKSPSKIDLTESRWFIFTFYNKSCIFGGVILSSDYDENTGEYTYQSQDFNRWLTSKSWIVNEEGDKTIYELIKNISDKSIEPFTINEEKYTAGLDNYYLAQKEEYEHYPVKMNTSTEAIGTTEANNSNTVNELTGNNPTITTTTNKGTTSTETEEGLDQKPGIFYEDKTIEEILQSLWTGSGCAVDMYVDNSNILRFDPLKLDTWKNPQDTLYFTINQLTGYNFKSDTTNIVTQVTIKDTDIYKSHNINEPNVYNAYDLMGFDLVSYYGLLNVFVSNPNSESLDTTTTADTSSDTTSDSTSTDSSSSESSSSSSGSTSSSSRRTTRKTTKSKKYLKNLQSSGTLVRSSIRANHNTASMQTSGYSGTSTYYRINR